VSQRDFKHVFGPVPSRRLGRSLGVDLVPHKTCTYDCLYCQIGRTTAQVLERAEFVPLEAVLDEVKRKLRTGADPDYVTLSGSGEPTLYSRLGELIAGLKSLGAPVAVLTNGSLLWQEGVAAAVAGADLACPSLDAGSAELWARVNRPPPGLDFERTVEGLVAFRRRFSGKLWLEVLLLAGLTDSHEEVRRIAALAARVGPDRVQLNTVVRPPAESLARAVPGERLQRLAEFFDPPAEVIAEYGGHRGGGAAEPAGPEAPARAAEVMGMLARRPCTPEDVAAGLGLHPLEASKLIADLIGRGRLVASERGGRIYYCPAGED
jgi:wyosine [tRNA(Phe)-imidazoG37] synthetase (radical SAM superfamily)